jgi:hypothetical protein
VNKANKVKTKVSSRAKVKVKANKTARPVMERDVVTMMTP